MIFNDHSVIKDMHSFLSPSKYHWINYDEEKLTETYTRHMAAAKGTRLHELAKELIELGIKLPKTNSTLNLYVNDAIGFKLQPEVPLYFSENCFGTADAIGYRRKILRIHDLKTGTSVTSMKQLMVYAAIFCLEYDVNPNDIQIELRIYQNNEKIICTPDPVEILNIMGVIISHDKKLTQLKILEG